MQANSKLTTPLKRLRLGAQLDGTAVISRSIPAGAVTLGAKRRLLVNLGKLNAGASAKVVVGFGGASTQTAMPSPAPILATFQSEGSLTGLKAAATVRYDSGKIETVEVVEQFEAMPLWFRCHDHMSCAVHS